MLFTGNSQVHRNKKRQATNESEIHLRVACHEIVYSRTENFQLDRSMFIRYERDAFSGATLAGSNDNDSKVSLSSAWVFHGRDDNNGDASRRSNKRSSLEA
jgi:hypothetical protein